MDLLGMPQQEFPFQTLQMDLQHYKLFGLVTNMDWDGESLIHWHRGRCGKSEEAHSVMKGDFAGGQLPSGDFGENAAWWWIMILAMNLNTIMKRLVLGGSWASRRMKAIRFSLINIPGRIVERSREPDRSAGEGASRPGTLPGGQAPDYGDDSRSWVITIGNHLD